MELDEISVWSFKSGAESKPGFFPRNLAALFWPSSNTGTTCHGIHVLRKSCSQSIRVTAQLVSPIEKASAEQKPLLTVRSINSAIAAYKSLPVYLAATSLGASSGLGSKNLKNDHSKRL